MSVSSSEKTGKSRKSTMGLTQEGYVEAMKALNLADVHSCWKTVHKVEKYNEKWDTTKSALFGIKYNEKWVFHILLYFDENTTKSENILAYLKKNTTKCDMTRNERRHECWDIHEQHKKQHNNTTTQQQL